MGWIVDRANQLWRGSSAAPAPAPAGNPVGAFTVVVDTAVLNVRAAAGTGSAVTATVKAGEIFTIVATNGAWGQLKSGAGWICLDYTKRVGAAPAPAPAPVSHDFKVQVGPSALNIRAGAGTQYGIAGVIRDQGIYTIVETKAGWGRLKSGAGWIHLDYVDRV
jgi:uncharacterized protein YgiM (DUF1202 family)